MARVASSVTTHKRHKKILKRAKGFYGARSKNYKTARQAVRKAMAFSTRDRKQRARRMRRLWIMRLNAAARAHGLKYSSLIEGLAKLNIAINRKILSDIAVKDSALFEEIINKVKAA